MKRGGDSGVSGHDTVFADDRIAEALLDAIGRWPDWCHRRVDSVHPLAGERGRVRHSMDCSPPPDPWLAYLPQERGAKDVTAVRGQVVVPLAIVVKQPMRELDASDGDGRPLPLLSMEENIQLAVAMMSHVLDREGIVVSAELKALLAHIAGPHRDGETSPTEVANGLLDAGTWNGIRYWNSKSLVPEVVDLIRDFARGFLLAALLPAGVLGTRQVLKLSFHWRIEFADGWVASMVSRAHIMLGASRSIALPMTAPSDTRSYHLEFQTPPELDCVRLELPSDDGGTAAGMVDESGQPVAHVHGRYPIPPVGEARAHLVVPRRGLWTYACLAMLVTSVTIWLTLLLPGAMEVLRETGDGAAAVLLAVPAVAIGVASGHRESALAAWMLVFLRFAMMVCSLTLLVLAWALVGELREPWGLLLWLASAGWTTALLFGTAVVGPVRSRTGTQAGRLQAVPNQWR